MQHAGCAPGTAACRSFGPPCSAYLIPRAKCTVRDLPLSLMSNERSSTTLSLEILGLECYQGHKRPTAFQAACAINQHLPGP